MSRQERDSSVLTVIFVVVALAICVAVGYYTESLRAKRYAKAVVEAMKEEQNANRR